MASSGGIPVQGNPLFGKFGPIILLGVLQLVLILAVPSTAPNESSSAFGGTTNSTGTGGDAGSGAVPGVNGSVGGVSGGAVSGATGGAGGGTTTGSAAGGATTAGAPPNTNASGAALTKLAGDRSHCFGDRQYDPNLDFYAPPCVPGKPGAADPNNGGQTWRGVSGDTIEVVNYVADYGAEVDKILQAQGLYYNANTAKAWNQAYSDFINSHYQLWGRKLHVDTVEGTCRTVPPDYSCLVSEMDSIVAKYHPYGVFWETTVCSVCFAELSRLKVVNFGGGGFSDKFHNDNAPYSYDAGESATQVQLQFADWWCKQMAGKPAIFAGTKNGQQNLRGMKRQLGVVSTNDPDNKTTVQTVLYPALQKCGESVKGHDYFYAQDINTATQQSQTEVARMNTPTNPATSVLCLCDPVAPQFGYNASAADNYWPESLLGDDQTMDFDSNGQTYSSSDTSNDSLACPNGNPCPYDNAIGLSSNDPQESPSNTPAVKIWKAQTGGKALPIAAATLDIVWNDWNMFASLIQNAGPILTPARMQAAAPDLGLRGGGATGHPLKGFTKDSWCWIKDVRVVYWNKNKKSPYNGKPGTYVQIEGGRFNMNFPSLPGQPPAPAPENRR
jgi:hypothetical protein